MRIATIDPSRDAAAVDDIIKIYQAAFGGEPWNEGWKCLACSHAVSLHPAPSQCVKCGGRMEQYWPYAKVIADFRQEMGRPNAQCLVATVQRKLVGFAWGYDLPITKDTIAEVAEHLDTPELSQTQWGLGQTFFYLDDVAVHPDHQKDGIGKQLVRAIKGSRPNMLLRTLENSQMFRLTKGLGGQTVFSISRGRVIMYVHQHKSSHSPGDCSGGTASRRSDDSPTSDPGFGRVTGGGH